MAFFDPTAASRPGEGCAGWILRGIRLGDAFDSAVLDASLREREGMERGRAKRGQVGDRAEEGKYGPRTVRRALLSWPIWDEAVAGGEANSVQG